MDTKQKNGANPNYTADALSNSHARHDSQPVSGRNEATPNGAVSPATNNNRQSSTANQSQATGRGNGANNQNMKPGTTQQQVRGQNTSKPPTNTQNPPGTAGANKNSVKTTSQPATATETAGAVTIGHYILGKHLGKGTFGQVKLGQHTLTGEKVAVKILEKDKIHDQKDVERITREIKILKKVRHPNVIQLYEIIETEKELYMIMEYCNGGELFDYIVKHTRLSEKQACKFYLELISGIEYIHQSGVCHRDLKPENLLLDYDLTLKIVDFGLSNMYETGATLKTACGSPCYAAPEMIAGKRYHGLRTDIWSSGVVFYAMVCGYLPFEDPKTSNLYKKIMGAEYTLPKFLSGQCKDLVRRILNTDPEGRFTVNDIRNHTWSLQIKDRNRNMGYFPGKEKMPIDDKLYEKILDEFNFDRKYASKCIEDNRHNHITACYHLIDKRNKKIKDRQESYQLTKIDFKKKMRLGTNIPESDDMKKTVVSQERGGNNHSPNQNLVAQQKQDLNMTAPLHSEQVKNGRKILNEFVGSPIQTVQKARENSFDYQTIQHGTINKTNQQYASPNERIAAFHRRAQTRGNNTNNQNAHPIAESKSPDKYTINNNLVVNLNDSVVKPVKRENSNTTNATHVTGITASTAGTQNPSQKNQAFYTTQYKNTQGKQGGFFPATAQSSNTSPPASGAAMLSTVHEPIQQKNVGERAVKTRGQPMSIPPGTANTIDDRSSGNNYKMQGGRFRSIQQSQNSNGQNNKNQPAVMMQNPNHSIDVGQLPMRLVNQKNTQRKGGNGNAGRNNNNQQIINGMIQNGQMQSGSKNAWQSIDTSSIQNDQKQNQGLMFQPCSNQAQNLISGPAAKIDISRPSVTQGNSNPQTAGGGQRSPRTSNNIKNQFYAVHGRGMSIQGNGQTIDHNGQPPNAKGILTKIFKNQHNRQQTFHNQQNYTDHLNQTHGGGMGFQNRGPNAQIINQIKSPNNNLREHLHTQGRTRAQNQTLETGQALGSHQRGGSLNIQELYSHYQKGALGPNQNVVQNGRNVTYYTNKNAAPANHQHLQTLDQQSANGGQAPHQVQHQNNFMNQSQIKTPSGGQNGQNNIFVPGSMRFAVMNRGQNNGNGGGAPQGNPNLTAQQQKIFEMNNNQHNVGGMGGMGGPQNMAPPMAMSFHKNSNQNNQPGPQNGILPSNVMPQTHANNFINRKKINTSQQNRSHSVNAH